MREKLSLEGFRSIKKEYLDFMEEMQEKYQDVTEVTPEIEQEVSGTFLDIQNRLISYDLSEIPFEEWDGLELLADQDHILDMSQTHANLDLSIVNGQYINTKGCNVRNLRTNFRLYDANLFDDSVINEHPELFIGELSSEEIRKKMLSGDATIEDIVSLTPEEIEMLKTKKALLAFHYREREYIEFLGFDRAIELYNYSKDDFEYVRELSTGQYSLYRFYSGTSKEIFSEALRNCEIKDIKKIANDYYRRILLEDSITSLNPDSYPSQFVETNPDIFMTNNDLPSDVIERYRKRELTLEDVLSHLESFRAIPIAKFLEHRSNAENVLEPLHDKIGQEELYRIISTFPNEIRYLADSGLDGNFALQMERFPFRPEGQDTVEYFKNYLHDFFVTNTKLNNKEQLLLYEPEYHTLEKDQKRVVDFFGLENIKRFERETGFFSHNSYDYSHDLKMFNNIAAFLASRGIGAFEKDGIDYENGSLTYEEFLDTMAYALNYMRREEYFADHKIDDYDFLDGAFREKYPDIFMAKDAPNEYKQAFYKYRINPDYIRKNPGIIPYLVDHNLKDNIRVSMTLGIPNGKTDDGRVILGKIDFVDEYIRRYGNQKFLDLCASYGFLLDNLDVNTLGDDIAHEDKLHERLRIAVRKNITSGKMSYRHLESNKEFVTQYPELFVDFSSLKASEEEINELTRRFYNRELNYIDIRKYPQLVDLLKGKSLGIAFGNKIKNSTHDDIDWSNNARYARINGRMVRERFELELINLVGQEEFLKMCADYGDLIENSARRVSAVYDFDKDKPTVEQVRKVIEDYITEATLGGYKQYDDEYAPDFLRTTHPELFLSDDAPEDLKDCFYKKANNILTFKILVEHKDWLPFLKGKAVRTALLRSSFDKDDINEFFDSFGEEKAFKLGIAKAETVTEMIRASKVGLMKEWYDKTGGKFIPDYVVMLNMSIDEADKFLDAGVSWSQLMNIKQFSKDSESREAMFKLAYLFGTFDHDQRGFKKLVDLLTALPKTIDKEYDYIFERFDNLIDETSKRKYFNQDPGSDGAAFKNMSDEEIDRAYGWLINNVSVSEDAERQDSEFLIRLLETMRKEKVEIDFTKPFFSQLYRKYTFEEKQGQNGVGVHDKRKYEDGTLVLTLNEQKYPKTAALIRETLSQYSEFGILTPNMAHQLFGGFDIKYDPDFREFLLKNLDIIKNDSENSRYLASIQKQFDEIKAVNANRTLTWDLAVSYVQTNQYDNVEVGNERVAEISSIAGYSQSQFDTLQRIYNHGKQRVYSSIPRISKTTEEYHYEILRLDDPMAMAIGTLTDCCQELGNAAESCMVHSMVDKHGRVFIIKDNLGNIIAQSWVWRNKDVICFDNIEIPKKAFERRERENPTGGRDALTEEVYQIYKQAAHELIEEDEKVYKRLLEEGKITESQYEGLRLGKVTVGLGYNDIKAKLKEKAPVDKQLSYPPEYTGTYELGRSLYTNDSLTQHILEEREDRKPYDGKALTVHYDEAQIYTDETFNQNRLMTLEKLEMATRGMGNLNTAVSQYAKKDHLVSEIADNYGLRADSTKIAMGPNYAIIFDEDDSKIRIADVLYNMNVKDNENTLNIEGAVFLQLRVAIDQIKGKKDIAYKDLSPEQIAILEKIIGLDGEIDTERGL